MRIGPATRIVSWLLVVLASALVLLAVLVRLNERHLIYFPARELVQTPTAVGLAYDDVWLRTEDGVNVHGWWVPASAAAGPVVLFLHGNAGNISYRLEKLTTLRELGASTLIIDYRGYGRSEGQPDEAGLSLDAAAAYRHLGSQNIDERRVVLYGESLGTAVAARLAATQPVAGVVLESGFASARSVARELYGMLPVHWFIRSRFDTVGALGQVHAPVLILHSRDDEFFGMHHAQQLAAAARGQVRLVELRGGHNDAFLVSDRIYREALGSFLTAVQASSGMPDARRGDRRDGL